MSVVVSVVVTVVVSVVVSVVVVAEASSTVVVIRRVFVGGITVDQLVKQLSITYNKFHLLVSSDKTENNKRVLQKVDYYAEDNIEFPGQLRNYQLPRQVQTTYYNFEGDHYRTETSHHEYDEFGNPTQDIQVNGVRTDRIYYSANGENKPGTGEMCPPDPYGFKRHVKMETITPCDSPYCTPTRVKRYAYGELSSVAGATSEHFAVVRQIKTIEKTPEGDKLISNIEYDYYEHKNLAQDYSRLKKQTKHLFKPHAVEKDQTYQYEYLSRGALTETIRTRTFDGYNGPCQFQTEEGHTYIVERHQGYCEEQSLVQSN